MGLSLPLPLKTRRELLKQDLVESSFGAFYTLRSWPILIAIGLALPARQSPVSHWNSYNPFKKKLKPEEDFGV